MQSANYEMFSRFYLAWQKNQYEANPIAGLGGANFKKVASADWIERISRRNYE